jgi:hypothetical protein
MQRPHMFNIHLLFTFGCLAGHRYYYFLFQSHAVSPGFAYHLGSYWICSQSFFNNQIFSSLGHKDIGTI